MAIVISTINLKGGVGKTQLTVGVAEILAADYDKKVLLIDLDPQTNATVMLIGDKKWKSLNKEGHTLYQMFKDKIDNTSHFNIDKAIVRKVSNIGKGLVGLDLLPSSLDLINIQDRIPNISQDQFGVVSPATILQGNIKDKMDDYDYILIDCPPNLGIITLNGLLISDYYIIPTKADYISTYGIPQILDRIKNFNHASKKNVKPLGIVITLYSGHQKNLHEEVISILKREQNYPKVFDHVIPFRQKIAETAYYDGSEYTFKQKYGDAYSPMKEIAKAIINEAV